MFYHPIWCQAPAPTQKEDKGEKEKKKLTVSPSSLPFLCMLQRRVHQVFFFFPFVFNPQKTSKEMLWLRSTKKYVSFI